MTRQSTNPKHQRDKTLAAYLRISRDDNKDESNSITTQRKLLTDAAKKLGFTNVLFFIDDGITGTKRDRKDFNRMIAELEKGHIGAVMVKDLSRFARDHIRADLLIEEWFPERDIRFIALGDGLDTADGEDEFTPFKNLMNEWYARDISKKRKMTNVVKGNAGEPLSPPPYGYIKDPENPNKRWIVDEEAAAVVRRIFEMALDGKGADQIAGALTEDKVLSPHFYWRSKGIGRSGNAGDREPHYWGNSTVASILAKQEYCGDVVNFKTYSKSWKLKKRLPTAEENKAIFKDVHEPIIDRAVWEQIAAKRGKTRKRKAKDGEKNMFSGFLICADCGNNLWFHFNQKNPDIKYFNCSGYNTRKGECPTTHYIRADFLEQAILQEIRCLAKFASKHEAEFARLVEEHAQQSSLNQRQRKQKELAAMRTRDKDLDKLFSRIYEDNISGKIDDERFGRMSMQYTVEQKELAKKIHALAAELDREEVKAINASTFIANARKSTRAKKLSERMLNDLIERIEVHQSEKVDGEHRQKLNIHYHCIGAIEIPNTVPMPEVSMQTRRGVIVTYIPLRQTG